VGQASNLIWIGILALAVALLVARALVSERLARHFMDLPNERSLHARPTPRTGGIALLLGVASALLLMPPMEGIRSGLLPVAVLALLSLLDDWRGIGAGVRLLIHLAVGSWVYYLGFRLALPGWPPLLLAGGTVLGVVWMINLYNFMDGMDGLAGGMALFGFGALGIMGGIAGDLPLAALGVAVAAAACGFLYFNLPPARLFLGDIGSTSLGLLAAVLILWGAGRGLFTPWIGLLPFLPFIADASVTLTQRALRGERVWQAHRSHYYQRAVLAGIPRVRVLIGAYLLMGGCAASAIAAARAAMAIQLGVVALWCLLLGGLMWYGERTYLASGGGVVDNGGAFDQGDEL